MSNINEKIRKNFNQFTKRQQQVAKYIIDHPKEVAFQTAKQVGQSSNTSETTVFRLSNVLGYSGFSEIQKEIQTAQLEEANNSNPIENFKEDTKTLGNKDLIQYVMGQDHAYIQATFEQIDSDQYAAAIDQLVNADKRFIIGFRSAYGPANWFTFSLNIIMGNTFLYRGEIEDANYLLSQITENTVVVAISFPRYSQETLTFVKAAKKKGAKILAITDDKLSPLGQFSDYLFKVIAPTPIAIKGITPTMALLNLIVTSVSASDESQKKIKGYGHTDEEYFPFAKK